MSTPVLSRSQVLQYPLHVPKLSLRISQRTYKTGYERFRPSIRGHHLGCRCYRGGWHRSYPVPYSPSYLHLTKGNNSRRYHSDFPRHAFAHCGGFAPAAPRRARTLISVSFWGLHLPMPLEIIGLVGRYPTNCLIPRSPILKRHIPIHVSFG